MNKKYISLLVATVLLTACGGGSSSSSKNDGEGSIDLAKYFPNKSMTKTFINTEEFNGNINKSHSDEIIVVNGNTITTTIDTEVTEKVVFSDKNITITTFDSEEGDSVESMYRNIDLGDTLFSKKIESTKSNDLGNITTKLNHICTIKSKEDKFEKGDNIYTGDLLKVECLVEGEVIYDVKQDILDVGIGTDLNGSHTIYDKSFFYLQKGLGEIVYINDDCLTDAKNPMFIDDNLKANECASTQYEYEFYLP